MTQALLQLQPNHGGAILHLGLIAHSENQKALALQYLRQASQLDQLSHDASALWNGLADMECGIQKSSDACLDAWRRSFEAEIELVPMKYNVATNALVNACKLLLERSNERNAKNIMEQVVTLGKKAVRLGLINAPLQLPKLLIRGVSFGAYRDDASTWKAIRHLEDNFQAIRDEVMEADAAGRLVRAAGVEKGGLHTAGEWRQLNINMQGRIVPQTLQLLPITSKIVLELEDGNSMVHGGSKISVMEPGTVVLPHTGLTNARVRIHLGISIPSGAFIRVGNETRTWTEGRCTAIDDSFVHEVWHTGTERRILLIVDIWHPEMDVLQREESISDPGLLKTYQEMSKDPWSVLRRQGIPRDLIPSRFISDAGYLNNKGT